MQKQGRSSGFAGMAAFFALSIHAPLHAAEAPQQIADLGRCKLSSSQVIQRCKVGYRLYGVLNDEKSNVVLFPSWYNGRTADMALLMGPSSLIDSRKYLVVTIDSLGDGVSSSPSNAAPRQRGRGFPKYTLTDMVDIEHRLAVEVLGLKHVHAVVGISMGGMQAFRWAIQYPEFEDLVIPIVGTPWLTSADRLTWSVMRQSIADDPGFADRHRKGEPALKLANEVDTMLSYTPTYFARTTPAANSAAVLATADAEPSIGAENRLSQIDAIEQLSEPDLVSAEFLKSVNHPKMFIVTSRNDHTVNPEPSMTWAKTFGSDLIILDGDCGHMAVQCELLKFAPLVKEELAK